jgi:antitoxin VapB
MNTTPQRNRKPYSKPQTAKLIATGRSQAVLLPKEFRFSGTHVIIRRQGQTVVLEPIQSRAKKFDWEAWWNCWTAAGDDFMPRDPVDSSQL